MWKALVDEHSQQNEPEPESSRGARSAIPNSSPTFTKALIGSAGGWYPSRVLNATDLAVSGVIDGR